MSVLPQAFRNMIPILLTTSIILFQDTSLVYAIGAYDLLKGFEIAGKNFNRPVETYLVAAALYFVISFVADKSAALSSVGAMLIGGILTGLFVAFSMTAGGSWLP